MDSNSNKKNASRFSIGSPIKHWYHLLIPVLTFAWSWTYDFPMILSSPLRETKHLSDQKIELLYSAYYLPNLFTLIPFG